MKKLILLITTLLVASFFAADLLKAQDGPLPVLVRDLHTYDVPLTEMPDIPNHPLAGVEVTFDAVVVAYPRNSGLASLVEGVPGRIHLFVTDVNAVEQGREGMTIQFVVDGEQRTQLEALTRGDVIRVIGDLRYFSATTAAAAQFNATDVEQIGNVFIDEEYEPLVELLTPRTIQLTDINQPAPDSPGQHTWISENYSNYIHSYVRIEGLEVIESLEAPNGRPWYILSDGTTILISNDTSLRYRNDRGAYAEDLGYNYRRLAEDLDGPFTPPPPGAVVDIQGFVLTNTFNPGSGFDVSVQQSTLKIAPWDDGIVWVEGGDNPDNRLEPEGWPNDLVVLGFAALLDNFSATPDEVFAGDAVTLSVDAILPEEDYTFDGAFINYSVDGGETQTVEMSQSGNSFSGTIPGQDAFNIVEYEVEVFTLTPEDVRTRASQSGSYAVFSSDTAFPPVFSPAPGTFGTPQSVTLSTPQEGGTIYYTINGGDPTEESTEYTAPINVGVPGATIRAITVADGLANSEVVVAEYIIEFDAVEIDNLQELRTSPQGSTFYQYTGEAVVTYTRSNRNQKYLMDDTGGLLIDDPGIGGAGNPGVITTEYVRGDVMTGLAGTLGSFSGTIQYSPIADPGAPVRSGEDIIPVEVTLADLDLAIHEASLVYIENVTIVDNLGDSGFTGNRSYLVSDPSLEDGETVIWRTAFGEADYIGLDFPTEPVNLTAIVTRFNDVLQITPRFVGDIELSSNTDRDELPVEFNLSQNYPNPFNPTTNISYTIPEAADVRLAVYDVLGRQVAVLVNGMQSAGQYVVNFDASRLASGMYIYRIEAGTFTATRKMMLIK